MANFNLSREGRYPEGTSVQAFPVSNWPGGNVRTDAAPVGSATETQVVTDGVAAFTELDADTRYVSYALVGGEHRYMYFATFTPAPTTESIEASLSVIESNPQTANYTLGLSDAGKAVEMDNASSRTITVPPNSSVAFPLGTVIEVYQHGAGTVTIAAGVGVTIRSVGGALDLSGQYAAASLRKRDTDEWVLSGALA